ncbi:MFS transporter [Acinetobacter wanghuae]|uniref:MFS transporter n=1 Tax=Acinetobacter wanghuae TaxID=2662362 RepID=A0A5Q0P1B2_9GAMM|nr:MFS transporter [Acinetobacter wanghuae]MQW92296.1 MFS transporter [Acinetobacter wanghuae]QGA10536.1 MFS transporter [Acinetobacter wanghuae]
MQNIYLLLFSLYWAQGLPVGFMTHALPVILRAEGVSLTHIGGFGLLMLPWSIKVFWAPLVDRVGSKRWGHYRSWIIPTQLLTVAVLIGLSFLPITALDQPLYLLAFFMSLLLMNTIGATQDVATDGLAVTRLKGEQQHWGNTFQVVGSRLGFIVGGGAILWLIDALQWQTTFLILAALVFLNTLPILLFKESSVQSQNPTEKVDQARFSLRSYFQYFLNNRTLKRWFLVLITFKLVDGLSGPILKPLMVDLGLSLSQIGVYITMLGAFAALLGAGLAGLCLRFISRAHTLFIFSILKIISMFGYAWLAQQYEAKHTVNEWVIYSINALEDMISAMLLVVMLTLIMQYSRKQYAATDFTFQVAIMATVSGGLYSISGIFADHFGYSLYLNFIVVCSLLSLIPIWIWKKAAKNN